MCWQQVGELRKGILAGAVSNHEASREMLMEGQMDQVEGKARVKWVGGQLDGPMPNGW